MRSIMEAGTAPDGAVPVLSLFRYRTAWPVPPAKGMSELARQTGLSCEQLYRSFSEEGNNPTLRTLPAVMKALGVEMSARPTGVCK